MSADRPPTIDPPAALRWANLMTPEAAAASPWLHEEVARRMEERLQWIKLQPLRWVHWEPVRGGLAAHAALALRYPKATGFVVEPSPDRARRAREALRKPWWSRSRWGGTTPIFAPPEPGSAQMVWANMALHMAADPQALVQQWHQALEAEGFLMFSCLGPDTLLELRDLYRALGWPPPAHEFTDMHDWGDMLVHAGFAEPVMDMERITLTFETGQRALDELRQLGRNLSVRRFQALRGRKWRDQLVQALDRQGAALAGPHRVSLSFEVIYGHALKARPRLDVRSETTLSLDEMRRVLQQGKGGPGGRT